MFYDCEMPEQSGNSKSKRVFLLLLFLKGNI